MENLREAGPKAFAKKHKSENYEHDGMQWSSGDWQGAEAIASGAQSWGLTWAEGRGFRFQVQGHCALYDAMSWTMALSRVSHSGVTKLGSPVCVWLCGHVAWTWLGPLTPEAIVPGVIGQGFPAV